MTLANGAKEEAPEDITLSCHAACNISFYTKTQCTDENNCKAVLKMCVHKIRNVFSQLHLPMDLHILAMTITDCKSISALNSEPKIDIYSENKSHLELHLDGKMFRLSNVKVIDSKPTIRRILKYRLFQKKFAAFEKISVTILNIATRRRKNVEV